MLTNTIQKKKNFNFSILHVLQDSVNTKADPSLKKIFQIQKYHRKYFKYRN